MFTCVRCAQQVNSSIQCPYCWHNPLTGEYMGDNSNRPVLSDDDMFYWRWGLIGIFFAIGIWIARAIS